VGQLGAGGLADFDVEDRHEVSPVEDVTLKIDVEI
jgi:hypothetical protein